MEDIKVWASLIGQFGLPLVVAVWYIWWELPAQRKREEERNKLNNELIERIIKDCDARSEAIREKDREHALEIQRLAGEIHKVSTENLVGAVNNNSKQLEELRNKLDKALEKFIQMPQRGKS